MAMGPSLKKLLWTVGAAALMLLSSCASLQHGWDKGNVEMVARLINAGQADKLAAMSSTPFLVDGEIVS